MIRAQDSTLLSTLNDSAKANQQTGYVIGTFKGIHLANMQTIEQPAKGALNFIIQHRFGKLNEGSYNFFGLDEATLRLGLDYGITNRFAVGIGRSSLDKVFDGYLKYKLLRQTDPENNMPVSISLLGTIANFTQKYADRPFLNARLRTSYTGQILIARKFSQFSLQISPTWLHFNWVLSSKDANDLFAAAVGARVKLNDRMSLLGEYNYLLPNEVISTKVYNSLSFAWEIETGGHVFQLVFSNSQGITEPYYISKTDGRWSKGDIFFGFNISRNFTLNHHSKKLK